MSERPELKVLIRVLRDLPWSSVRPMALQLGCMNSNLLQSVEEESHAAEGRLYRAMDKWLQGDVSASWDQLVQALTNVQLNVLAEEIRAAYCSGAVTPETKNSEAKLPPPSLRPLSSAKPHEGATQSDETPANVEATSASPALVCVVSTPLSPDEIAQSLPPPTQVLFPASNKTSSHVIPTKSTAIITQLEEKIKQIEDEVARLNGLFTDIRKDTHLYMREREKKAPSFLEVFRVTMAENPLLEEKSHPNFFENDYFNILDAQKVSKIFAILRPYSNYMNYGLLQFMISKFGDSLLKRKMDGYVLELETFEMETTVDDFAAASPDSFEIPEHFRSVIVKIKKDASKCTLYDIRKFLKSVEKKSSLFPYALMMQKLSVNTVIVHLAVPQQALVHVSMAFDSVFLKLHCIISVLIDERKLQLVRVDPGYIRLLWQMPKHIYQPVFSLTELQLKQLHELCVREFFCCNYKYTASAFMVKLDLDKLTTDLISIEKSLADLFSKNEHEDKTFLRKFCISVLQTKVTSKQKSLRLLTGHWHDILDSKNTATLLGKLTPFWDVMHPTLLCDIVQKFGDKVVKKQMENFIIQFNAFKSRVMLSDIQSVYTGRLSMPRDFTCVIKIKVSREMSHFSLPEVERYHNALIQCTSLNLSALRLVPAEQTETCRTTLTWHTSNEAIDLMKEFLDDVYFHDCGLSLESITLNDTPVQEFKEYQKGLWLITACREQDVQAVNTLLESGVDPDSKNQAQMTPLLTACDEGYTEVVQVLLKWKADPNLPAEKLTPLHYASYGGYLKIVQLLQENGAHIDPLDEDEHTPLHRACFNGHSAVVQFLLDHGANLRNTCNDGSSVVHQAANNGHCDTVKLLLTKYNAPIHVTDDYGSSALHWVSSRGHIDMMEVLIQRDRNILNMQDNEGLTSLMIAANAKTFNAVKLLVRYHCEVNIQNKEGLTALMMAAKHGAAEIVEILIKAHADVNIRENAVGWSAVFFAAKEGYVNIIKMLVRADAIVTEMDKNSTTALDQARLCDKEDVCAFLEPLINVSARQKSISQLHTIKDMAKQSGEKMSEVYHKLRRWLKVSAKRRSSTNRKFRRGRRRLGNEAIRTRH